MITYGLRLRKNFLTEVRSYRKGETKDEKRFSDTSGSSYSLLEGKRYYFVRRLRYERRLRHGRVDGLFLGGMIFMKKHGIFAVLSVLIAIALSLSAVFFIGCDKGENPDDSSKKTSFRPIEITACKTAHRAA